MWPCHRSPIHVPAQHLMLAIVFVAVKCLVRSVPEMEKNQRVLKLGNDNQFSKTFTKVGAYMKPLRKHQCEGHGHQNSLSLRTDYSRTRQQAPKVIIFVVCFLSPFQAINFHRTFTYFIGKRGKWICNWEKSLRFLNHLATHSAVSASNKIS